MGWGGVRWGGRHLGLKRYTLPTGCGTWGSLFEMVSKDIVLLISDFRGWRANPGNKGISPKSRFAVGDTFKETVPPHPPSSIHPGRILHQTVDMDLKCPIKHILR